MRRTVLAAIFASLTTPALAFNIGMPPTLQDMRQAVSGEFGPTERSIFTDGFESGNAYFRSKVPNLSSAPACVQNAMSLWRQLGATISNPGYSKREARRGLKAFTDAASGCDAFR